MTKSSPQGESRAPRNQTMVLTPEEERALTKELIHINGPLTPTDCEDRTALADTTQSLDLLPASFVDLLFLDPPYNLTKTFNSVTFRHRDTEEYAEWFSSWFVGILVTLKPTASIYVCADWRTSAAIHSILSKHTIVRNRITWEREKGRGSTVNWKNCAEDIWFCTVSDSYKFDATRVKRKRPVIAPYTDSSGRPRDWKETANGRFRLTYPSNLWTDLTVPFWSMPENTDHPTQKPEKLLAKIILASSDSGEMIFDPFLGSGTSSVVAKKLGRRYFGIEIDQKYCCLARKRLALADFGDPIQGYEDGAFTDRNCQTGKRSQSRTSLPTLFDSSSLPAGDGRNA